MTSEEASFILANIDRRVCDDELNEALDIAIKSLEAWEKVRAEIGMYEADCRLQGGTDECEKCNSNVFGSIYRIIDKYKAESEENNGNG